MSSIAVFLLCLFAIAQDSAAQSPVATISLTSDQIGIVRTAQGITTRIAFPDEVDEIICGDLYDSASGKGGFVAQRSGTDVFLKPIPAKGMSNLFVKTRSKRTYNFDLMIVPVPQSHRVVNVVDPKPGDPNTSAHNPQTDSSGTTQGAASHPGDNGKASEEAEAILTSARQRADDLVSAGRQQSDRLVSEAEARASEVDRVSSERASRQAEQRFVQALILGLRESKIENPKVVIKKIVITLDPRVLIFGDKSYVRYRLHNTGDKPFTFGSITLEASAGREATPVAMTIFQSKNDNRLESGESLTGVIAFDAKQVTTGVRLSLFLRAEDKAEIGRVTIQ
ncbi:MAG TPA: hypothetical protein VNH22_21060 [Blastocatellia bacterium]|jgi:vacuolar-type H+-ATPase subunit H|nr:hypothetical protein [Blastocatellia bacterium]